MIKHRMGRIFSSLCLGASLLAMMSTAHADGNYVNGVEGIKAASLPPPGVYWRWYNLFYKSTTLKDTSGNKSAADLNLDVFASVNRLIWITDKKFLGADYGMDLIIPLVNTNFKINNTTTDFSTFGVGDVLVEPVVLSWHGQNWDAATALGVYLPTGDYNRFDPSSPGLGQYTMMYTLGGTWYFDKEKTLSASLLSRYEIHGDRNEGDLNKGDDFHFEAGIGKKINDIFEVGIAGYGQWQMTDDSGRDAVNPTVHDRVFGIGPEVLITVPAIKSVVSIRGTSEFGGRDRPEGNMLTITLTKPLQ
ncbi:SphA family protein [Candidatus Magnetaquicoccus inordinatus]|uniref:SphA family protein n=1 Tax=Candidatus Magnetaquicoccus inordinatus TaxID=2496818 RepID=UPI00102BDF25|nr:transporter [Candidatus Magnetaquicoccus inordinatus]